MIRTVSKKNKHLTIGVSTLLRKILINYCCPTTRDLNSGPLSTKQKLIVVRLSTSVKVLALAEIMKIMVQLECVYFIFKKILVKYPRHDNRCDKND